MFQYVVLALALVGSTFATPMTQCSNGLPLPTSVQVNDCMETPCAFPHGSTALMNVTLTAPKALDMMHIEVVAHVLGIDTPYPLPQHDVCQLLLNTQCPVAEGEEVIFQNTMEILDIFPQIQVGLSFTLSDAHENGNGVVCFAFDAQVV